MTGRRSPRPKAPAPTLQTELLSIRGRLEVLAAAAYVSAAALRAESADADLKLALIAQRVIGDGITAQMERLAAMAAGCGRSAP